ncbi:hypothetical protein [Aliiroseovarius sp.]|uniref:hypothetical protein n=1 Tax=Aliiroseovarius sp. TaxID=1872442 RepID=UPI00261DE888|nr:hypothetical protein [Aliiroseovarius sp.]
MRNPRHTEVPTIRITTGVQVILDEMGGYTPSNDSFGILLTIRPSRSVSHQDGLSEPTVVLAKAGKSEALACIFSESVSEGFFSLGFRPFSNFFLPEKSNAYREKISIGAFFMSRFPE